MAGNDAALEMKTRNLLNSTCYFTMNNIYSILYTSSYIIWKRSWSTKFAQIAVLYIVATLHLLLQQIAQVLYNYIL